MEGGSVPALSNLEDALKAEQKVLLDSISLHIESDLYSRYVPCHQSFILRLSVSLHFLGLSEMIILPLSIRLLLVPQGGRENQNREGSLLTQPRQGQVPVGLGLEINCPKILVELQGFLLVESHLEDTVLSRPTRSPITWKNSPPYFRRQNIYGCNWDLCKSSPLPCALFRDTCSCSQRDQAVKDRASCKKLLSRNQFRTFSLDDGSIALS